MMRAKIEDLILNDHDFADLEEKLSVFCPFEAIGAESSELKHSNFLANIMDPMRPHGFGDTLLRAILFAIVRETSTDFGVHPMDIHLMDLDQVDIRREYKNIDLLIAIPPGENKKGLIIAIENKVRAKQTKNQLEMYKNIIRKEWPSNDWDQIFLYLTMYYDEPIDNEWVRIPYELIVEAVENSCRKIPKSTLSGQLIRSYSSMVRRVFLMSDKSLQNLATALWSKHKEALEFLYYNKPDIIADLIRDFSENSDLYFGNLKDELELEESDHTGTTTLRYRPRALERKIEEKFAEEVGNNPDRSQNILSLEIQRIVLRASGKFGIRVYLVINKNNNAYNENLKNIFGNWRIMNVKLFESKEDIDIDFEKKKREIIDRSESDMREGLEKQFFSIINK